MKEIGEFLKEKRLEKGMTIQQIADKTRMPVVRIQALEDGDISAFKDDITYLQFFMKSYCQALGIDFNEVKEKLNDSINSYTMSFETEQLRQHMQSEHHIQEVSEKRIQEYKMKNPQKRVKVDFSLISFLVVISLIVICVFTVGGYYLMRNFNQPDTPVVDLPNNQTEDLKPNHDKEEEKLPEVSEIQVEQEDPTHFVLQNVKDKVVLRIEFSANSWFQATLDGKVMTTPKSQVYDAGASIEIELDSDLNKELNMRFGFVKGVKFFVDDKEVALDESIASGANVQNFVFKLGEKVNESTK